MFSDSIDSISGGWSVRPSPGCLASAHHQLTEQHAPFSPPESTFAGFLISSRLNSVAEDAAYCLFVVALPASTGSSIRRPSGRFRTRTHGPARSSRFARFQTIFTLPLSGAVRPTGFCSMKWDLPTPLAPRMARSFRPLQQQVDVFLNTDLPSKPLAGLHFQRVTEQFLILLEADKWVLTAGGFNLLPA